MNDTRPIDMQALRIFLVTAQDCNMSKAGERLGISQSAVSQSIRLLEDSFGTLLLNRSSRPLKLTTAGMTLLVRGGLLMEEALNLRGAVVDASHGIKPNLRVGLVDSFAATCGTTLVQHLLRSTAQLSVRSGLTPNLGEALSQRDLDLVVSSRSLDLEGIANYPLMTEKFLVISPNESLTCRTKGDMDELARTLPIVRFNKHSHLGQQVERALRGVGLSPPHRLSVETAETLTSMVAGGIGWAVTTPLCLLQGAKSAPLVRKGVVSDFHAARTIYLQVRKGEYQSLGRETFNLICHILEEGTKKELRTLHPDLPKLIDIHPWNAG